MSYTEYYCDFSHASASNTNAGSTTGAPVATFTGGNWVSATGVFTKAGGDFSAITVGMFAAVMVDGGTVAALVGRITAVDDTADTCTISTTAKSGSLADQTGTGTLRVGGVWKGPNAAVAFPVNFIAGTGTNAAGDFVRVNLKNGTNYAITAAMTHSTTGAVTFCGYTTAAGDGGKAIIDGGTTGASYVLLTLSGSFTTLQDLIFQNNGATGSANGVTVTGQSNVAHRCVFNSVRGTGLSINVTNFTASELEAYACNQSNTNLFSGFRNVSATELVWVRCIAHDNAGSLANGFYCDVFTAFRNCTADTNGLHGIYGAAGKIGIFNCDVYNNVAQGVNLTAGVGMVVQIENSNFVKNGTGGTGYGVSATGGGKFIGTFLGNAFGAGTQANATGQTTGLGGLITDIPITYSNDVTPWVDPANGDFRINLTAAKATGRGSFTETAASYAGTVGYPDIGSAQHLEAAAGVNRSLLPSGVSAMG